MIELACPCGYRWSVKHDFGFQQLCTACILYRRIQRYRDFICKLQDKRWAILAKREARAAARQKETE